MKSTLYLTVTKEWFDKIVRKEKNHDFREIKDHWISRLCKRYFDKPNHSSTYDFKTFDEVHIKNGYRINAPLVIREYLGTTITFGWYTDLKVPYNVFDIALGDILEIQNYNIA